MEMTYLTNDLVDAGCSECEVRKNDTYQTLNYICVGILKLFVSVCLCCDVPSSLLSTPRGLLTKMLLYFSATPTRCYVIVVNLFLLARASLLTIEDGHD
jgi:hypothetical protein